MGPTREIEKLRYGSRLSCKKCQPKRRHISILPLSRIKSSRQRCRPNFSNSRLEKKEKECLLKLSPWVLTWSIMFSYLYISRQQCTTRQKFLTFNQSIFKNATHFDIFSNDQKNAPHNLSEILVFQVCMPHHVWNNIFNCNYWVRVELTWMYNWSHQK